MKPFTSHRARLHAEAEAAGYAVTMTGGDEFELPTVEIIKRHPHTGHVYGGIVIYPDGAAFSATVRLDFATAIRTQKGMRSALGLGR